MIWSAHLSTLFREHEPLDRPAAARAAGFTVADSWWPPDGARAWAEEVLANQLEIALLNTPRQSSDDGGPWLNDPARRDDAVADLRTSMAIAELVGAGCVSVPVGDQIADRRRSRQLGEAAAALRELGTLAACGGLTLVIEPLSARAAPGYLLGNASTAAELIEAAGSDSVRILFDAFHSAESGRDPVSELRPHADLIAHVQYADSPGRGAPGSGRSSVWRLIEGLDAVGYRGAIGLEFFTGGPTADALGFLAASPTGVPVALRAATESSVR
jgi:hydroxypyruvate isomerase